ncbi:GNAT family N-acetyltransferase [Mesobacterium pallidum]|uniref:GNAT family N-acetyltransferase n=1 Tax=Mesobacterium pallidum TaxID=2872037 RepID=UPI001EE38E92|nr:GNAT family N-acetyltransferase [Mesobacterium pallidum]
MSLTNAPRLETPRLILRGPEKSDAEHVIRFLQDPLRSEGFGHIAERGNAWRWFAMNVGHWHWHGYGYFVIETREGEVAGISGIWNPETWPEPEVGWVVFDGFEGRGIAFEAAFRARQWAYEELGFTTLTSNIVPGNDRSVALARRLGARYERTYVNTNMGEDELWRHPSPEDLADGGMEAYA